jgi:class 3 adenylate cyclase
LRRFTSVLCIIPKNFEKIEKRKGKSKNTHYYNRLSREEFDSFTPKVLGIGDISAEGSFVQCLVAFFDLEGFSDFSLQPESHLVIPEFLSRYLEWLFATLRKEFTETSNKTHVDIWGGLPFFAKFMGDGIMLLWDTSNIIGKGGIHNTIHTLSVVTKAYESEFLKTIRKQISKPPKHLRCGIARGQAVSVGGGLDYVGPCINIASRLQKLSTLSFVVSRRGVDIFEESDLGKILMVVKTSIRSIGEEELVYVLKNEFEGLPSEQKKFFEVV